MADDIDIANELIARDLSRALDKLRQNSNQDMIGPKTCTECGDIIPEGRRKLGFKLCLPCAEEDERRRALFKD